MTKKRIQITGGALIAILLLFLAVLWYRNLPTDDTDTEPISITGFQLNTVITITIYDSQDESLLSQALELCADYERIFSRTDENSELYQLNHRTLPQTEEGGYAVSDELAELISIGLEYSRLSEGAFDITVEPVSSLWDFTSGEDIIPSKEEISASLSHVGYEQVQVNGNTVTFADDHTTLDLGAIAKGYIADRLKEYLESQGVASAIINLGGNVLCIGQRSADTPFSVGIQQPFADRQETIAAMEITDQSVVSSGIYERYFEKDGQIYHHILNPKTGYPYDNDLVAVTIISDASVDGDALSTTCFALGLEKGLELLNSTPDVHGIFITEDYQLHYTDGFEEEIVTKESGS